MLTWIKSGAKPVSSSLLKTITAIYIYIHLNATIQNMYAYWIGWQNQKHLSLEKEALNKRSKIPLYFHHLNHFRINYLLQQLFFLLKYFFVFFSQIGPVLRKVKVQFENFVSYKSINHCSEIEQSWKWYQLISTELIFEI